MTHSSPFLSKAFASCGWRAAAAATLLACATAMTACASGVTYIEGGQTFLLGGNQTTSLWVEGRNVGPVPVEILSRKDGIVSVAKKVEPGQLFSQSFAVGETALIRNTSTTRQAQVGVQFTQLVKQMSMRYEAATASSAASAVSPVSPMSPASAK
jgi:hypothetical protein